MKLIACMWVSLPFSKGVFPIESDLLITEYIDCVFAIKFVRGRVMEAGEIIVFSVLIDSISSLPNGAPTPCG